MSRFAHHQLLLFLQELLKALSIEVDIVVRKLSARVDIPVSAYTHYYYSQQIVYACLDWAIHLRVSVYNLILNPMLAGISDHACVYWQ